jgi:serine phosphatase RsbU (regulator of sigma subunit)
MSQDVQSKRYPDKVEQPNPADEAGHDEPALRADAAENRERILTAAAALRGDRRVTMLELAGAAGVGRSTLYRHFPNRRAVLQALDQRTDEDESPTPTRAIVGLPFRTPGRLGRGTGLPLEVTHVLDEVPPHLIADQLVAEARRAGGVPVALYVVDIDGSQLVRLAGTEDFPAELDAPPALGPEIVPEGLPLYYFQLREELPGCTIEPLWLRGRVTGLLLCIGTPLDDLADIAKQGAAALELANDYTDVIESARRRKPPTPAAEIQQNLFPPRIARITGAQLAGGHLPTYEVGGDWFDFVENRDGAWLAIGDASGNGPTAAGLSAAVLGALRAARRSGHDLQQAVAWMDETVRRHKSDHVVTTLIGRWRAATGVFTYVNCGHPYAYIAETNGELRQFESRIYDPLGQGDGEVSFTATEQRLVSGQRLILVTAGVPERKTASGVLGEEGIRAALTDLETPTAATTAMAILNAVSNCWTEPLEDDGTVVVLCVD